MTRVLVFGGSGLIGAATVRLLLDRGHEAVLFSRGAASVPGALGAERGDIADKAAVSGAFAKWRPDAVLQLAACLQVQCQQDPAGAVATNVTGATNVLDAAADHGVGRFIFASSIAAYGERHDLMREDDPPAPQISIYGEMKRLGERLGIQYAAKAAMSFAALRYSGVFGTGGASAPGMSLARHMLMETAAGNDAELDFVNGEELAHLTYVADAAEASYLALTNAKLGYPIYNIGGPAENHISLKGFHAAVRHAQPGAGNARFGTQPGAKPAGPVDITRMRDDLGWSPRYGVEAGIKAALTAALGPSA